MKAEELKNYIRLRGLKVARKKAVLVTRAFSVFGKNVAVIKNAEEVEAELKQENDDKLKLDKMNISDPFKLDNRWLDDEEGIGYWPILSTCYIIQFLMVDNDAEDLRDYKGSKAYSYFKQSWPSNISYHSLGSSKNYWLKKDCRPSERLKESPNKLWVCLSKNEGKVITAHCTCMAGMNSTCKHVAAALFLVEAAMRLGLTNPTCTIKTCE